MQVLRTLAASVAIAGSGTSAWFLADVWGARVNARIDHPASQSVQLITDVVTYTDPDFDFIIDIPAGWTPVVALLERDEAAHGLVIPHTVSFEVPRESDSDAFSDYVMIEIIPGNGSGQFLTDGSRARAVTIDGVRGKRESLAIDQHRIGDESFDLIVHQAEIKATGYSVGFFAIGEPKNRQMLDDVFELMINSFEFVIPPYRVS